MCDVLRTHAVGRVDSLFKLEMLSSPLISARLSAEADLTSLISRFMNLMGGGPNGFHRSRPCVKAASMLNEWWVPVIGAVMSGSLATSLSS